jgi:putative transcriptional regulator
MITAANLPWPAARAALLVALLGASALLSASPVRALPPAQGTLLVANPDMRGTWFARSVVLLIQHDESGTVGLIVNRPTDTAPVDVLPDVAGLTRFEGDLYIGGPVETYGIMMLVRTDEPPPDAEHVFANVYASGSLDLLQSMVAGGTSAHRVRLYAGYAGWIPGQLDAEIRRGSWTVVAAAEQHVFSNDPEGVWKRLAPPSQPIIVRRDDGVVRY